MHTIRRDNIRVVRYSCNAVAATAVDTVNVTLSVVAVVTTQSVVAAAWRGGSAAVFFWSLTILR